MVEMEVAEMEEVRVAAGRVERGGGIRSFFCTVSISSASSKAGVTTAILTTRARRRRRRRRRLCGCALALDDEDRPAAAARVGEDAQLLGRDVAHERDFGRDLEAAPRSWRSVCARELVGVVQPPTTKILVAVEIVAAWVSSRFCTRRRGGARRWTT